MTVLPGLPVRVAGLGPAEASPYLEALEGDSTDQQHSRHGSLHKVFHDKKKSPNLSGQKKHQPTTWDKKNTQPLGIKKKKTQPLGLKKITQPLETKKITQPFGGKKITQPLGTKKCRIRPTIDPLALV